MPQQAPPAAESLNTAPSHLFQIARKVRSMRRDHALMAGLDKNQAAEFIRLERKVFGDEKAMVAKMRADPSEDAAIDVDLWDARQMIETGQEMIAEGKRKLEIAEAKNREAKLRYSSYRVRQRLGKIEAILSGGPDVAPRPINPFIGGDYCA